MRLSDAGKVVTLAGWVQRIRKMGVLTFVDLRDRYGITQLVFNENENKELFDKANSLGREYVIQATGKVNERSSKNEKIDTGEIEIIVSELNVLNESLVPPFTIEENTDGGDDLRMKYRYLDLRRANVRRNLELRHKMCIAIRQFLDSKGFLEIETPVLVGSTPEGARDFVVPSRMNPGQFYALPQSPQTLKQLLMVAGMDRYFQIVKCFRDEDLRADRQPEFTQIDCEMSFVEQDDIISMFEEMAKYLFKNVRNYDLGSEPFLRLPWIDAMRRFGSDKPDMRFGMEFVELADTLKDTGERVRLSSMGDGINRILTVILALVNCKGGVFLLDEFETGLHYTVQTQLWRVIFMLSEKLNVQVFATSHSHDCINSFIAVNRGGQIIRLDNRGGEIVAVNYSDDKEMEFIAQNGVEIR